MRGLRLARRDLVRLSDRHRRRKVGKQPHGHRDRLRQGKRHRRRGGHPARHLRADGARRGQRKRVRRARRYRQTGGRRPGRSGPVPRHAHRRRHPRALAHGCERRHQRLQRGDFERRRGRHPHRLEHAVHAVRRFELRGARLLQFVGQFASVRRCRDVQELVARRFLDHQQHGLLRLRRRQRRAGWRGRHDPRMRHRRKQAVCRAKQRDSARDRSQTER